MTIDARAKGWLTREFHLRFRETLLHTAARHDILCPAYCLMPDHIHLLWMGIGPDTDQRQACKFFREYLNPILRDSGATAQELQKQAYDHVLRQQEKVPDAVRAVACYIFENPVRAGLVSSPSEWPHLGAMMAGFPKCDPMAAGFWDWFWRMRERLLEQNRGPGGAGGSSGTA